jgi:hypothetical protein
VAGTIGSLRGFAELSSLAVSTESGGEDAVGAKDASQIRELDLEGLIAREYIVGSSRFWVMTDC